jgi:hypothetical protein
MELFEDIRKAHTREDASIRELAERYKVHRRTVRQALAHPVPPTPWSSPGGTCPFDGPWPGRQDVASRRETRWGVMPIR